MVWDLVLANILTELAWIGIGIILAIVYFIWLSWGSK